MVDIKSKRRVRVEADFTRFVAELTNLTSSFLGKPFVVRTELLQSGIKYRASCRYRDEVWRDWVNVFWDDYGTLPSKIWGFIDMTEIGPNNVHCGGLSGIPPASYAIVESAEVMKPRAGEYQSKIFKFVKKEVATMENHRVKNLQFYLADVEAFDETLVVIPDIGGEGNVYMLMSPRSEWAENFGKWLLKRPHEKIHLFESDAKDSSEEEESSVEPDDSSAGSVEESVVSGEDDEASEED